MMNNNKTQIHQHRDISTSKASTNNLPIHSNKKNDDATIPIPLKDTTMEQQQHHCPKSDDDDDPVGACIVAMLNSDIFNNYSQRNSQLNEILPFDTFTLYPLFSAGNLTRLKNLTFQFVKLFCFDPITAKFDFTYQLYKGVAETSASAFKITLAILPIFVIWTHVYINILQGYAMIFILASYLFIDIRDFMHICPKCFISFTNSLITIWNRFQSKYLFVDEYMSRDAHTIYNTAKHCEQNVSLFDRLPPLGLCYAKPDSVINNYDNIQYDDVNWKSLRHSLEEQLDTQIGDSSLNHHIAVNFCYVMLQNSAPSDSTTTTRKNKEISQTKQSNKMNKLKQKLIKTKSRKIPAKDGNDANTTLSIMDSDLSFDSPGFKKPLRHSASFDAIEIIDSRQKKMSKMNKGKLSPVRSNKELHSPHYSSDNQSDSGFHDDNISFDSDVSYNDDVSFTEDHSESTENISIESKSHTDDPNLKWIDVGAKIGMQLLKSEHVQKVITSIENPSIDKSYLGTDKQNSDAIENSKLSVDTNLKSKKSDALSKPFHTMWNSPSADAIQNMYDNSEYSLSDNDDESLKYVPKNRDNNLFTFQTQATKKNYNKLKNMSILTEEEPSNTMKLDHTISSGKNTKKFVANIDTFGSSKDDYVVTTDYSPTSEDDRTKSMMLFSPVAPISNKEPIPHLPKKFDADIFLPLSMTIATNQTKAKNIRRRLPLLPGVKILTNITSNTHIRHPTTKIRGTQMGTVISSQRINVMNPSDTNERNTDCLSVTVLLEKSLLRNGKFVKMTFRIMDSHRHFPRHSKFPIGSCVATSFGIGILVGWRVEDDCHIIRSLWQKRRKGAAHAYLNRNCLIEVVEAAVGFKVDTKYGSGKVLGYNTEDGTYKSLQYIVQVKRPGRYVHSIVPVNRKDVIECRGAKFIPVVEQIREAANYQIQIDSYEAAKLQHMFEDEAKLLDETWKIFSEGFELFLNSFIKAAEEDEYFDDGVGELLSSVINVLEGFNLRDGEEKRKRRPTKIHVMEEVPSLPNIITADDSTVQKVEESGFLEGLFGDLFHLSPKSPKSDVTTSFIEVSFSKDQEDDWKALTNTYKKIYAFLRTITRTVAIARSNCVDKPNLKLALSIIHEFLLFVKTVIKVQQKNMSQSSVEAWKKTLDEFGAIFGPMNIRLQKVCDGILQRLETHGNITKIRSAHFADIVLADDTLVSLLDAGDYMQCIDRLEHAAVKANMIDEESCAQYHKVGLLLYNTMAPRAKQSQEAAIRNGKKLTLFAKALKIIATPGRSLLRLLTQDDVVEIIERILTRVFEREKEASLMLNIHAWNFRSFRHLRLLSNMDLFGTLWAPVLDAADEELNWAISRTPDSTKDYVSPFGKLFSLGVARFHELQRHASSADWLDFLMDDEAVELIQRLDSTLLMSLKNFCRDVREMMYILPYYSSIDEDILNVIDEVDLDKLLKEAADAFVDSHTFPDYVREKSAEAVSRFMDYLPRMSIPIERREIGEGWVITCRGRNGQDLTLSNVSMDKDNLLCKVLGGGNVLSPVLGQSYCDSNIDIAPTMSSYEYNENIEVSVLDHIASLIKNAQNDGCWNVGVGGITTSNTPNNSGNVCSRALDGVPLSEVLRCAVDLWNNLELDDDELLEIAIRDISYQIQIQKEKEDGMTRERSDSNWSEEASKIRALHQRSLMKNSSSLSFEVDIGNGTSLDSSLVPTHRRFDPKKDPTVLFLGMNKLTCSLEDFTYRIEPAKQNSIFDPVFEGVGSLSVLNASISLRIECRKERLKKMNEEITVPVLQLSELSLGLEQVNFQFKETGADWILNKIIGNFSDKITQVVRSNLQEQISLSIHAAIKNLNSYIEVNPDIMLKILGISIDDLEEDIAWV